MSLAPFNCVWTGDVFVPRPHVLERIREEVGAGEVVQLTLRDADEDRTQKSHNHYFACIKEAFNTIPEAMEERWGSTEHLRKWALIQAGYRNERTFSAASKAEALRLAAFIRPMNEFAVVIVREAVVVEWTAKSQSRLAMGKTDFGASKKAVLAKIAEVLGVEPESLGRAAT